MDRNKEYRLRKKMVVEEREFLSFCKVSQEILDKSDGSFFMNVFRRGRKDAIREMARNALKRIETKR